MQFTRWQQLLGSLDYPLVFTDLETTSASIDRAQVLEVGCAFYVPDHLSADDSSTIIDPAIVAATRAPGLTSLHRCRCNPGKDVLASSEFRRAEQIHRLSAELLKGHPTFAHQAKHVAGWLDSGYVIGFNSEHYDMPLLVRRLTNAGYALDPVSRVSIDVWRVLAHIVEGKLPAHGTGGESNPGMWPLVSRASEGLAAFKQNLGTVHEALLGVPPDKQHQHGALYDDVLTANVLAAAMELWPEHVPATIEGLQHMSTVPPRNWPDWDHFLHFDEETKEWCFTRGEHRGLALQEAPGGYLSWILKKGTFERGTLRVVGYFDRMRKHLWPGLLRAREDLGLSGDA